MSYQTIGGKIVLEGENEYRAALKNITAGQKELRSEMTLSQATFKDQQNSLEALQQKYDILTKQIDKQAERVDVYQQAVTSWGQKQREAADKVEDLRTALEAAKKEMDAMKEGAEGNTDAIEAQEKVIQELSSRLTLAEQGYDKAARKTTSYQTALNNARAELSGMENELSQTKKYLDEAEVSTDQCAHSIDEYGNETKEAAEATSVFGDVLKANLLSDAIRTGIQKLAEGIERIASGSIDAGSSFEASMSQVAATMGLTTQEINEGSEAYTMLSEAAKESGKTSIFSASESAEALNYLALAGYDAQKAVATLPKALDLAAAGGLDLAYATDLVTDSAAALNLQTDRLDTYIDQMARTSQKSNTSIAQLGEATLVCAGTVSLAQQSLETMNTELGILANNGIKGAEGGTHLRNIILALSAPTDTAAKTIRKLGIEVSDSQGNMRDLNDILTDLNSAMADMSSVKKSRLISTIFNKTDITAVNALLKGTGEEFDNLYREISNSSGAAKEMAKTLNDNLKGKVTILKSALEGLGISTYEIFDSTMKRSVESATDAVGRLQKSIDSGSMGVSLNKLSESLGNFVDGALRAGEDALPVLIDGLSWLLDHADIVMAGITGITAANLQMKVVGPAINGVTAAWTAYKKANEGATISQWLLNTAMSANPAGILLGAVTALTAAVAAYVIINKDNLFATDEVTKATKEQVEAAKSLNKEMAATSASRKEERKSLEDQAVICRNLVAELKELQVKTNLTSTEQARMRMIVEELNQVMPDLNLQIDEQTGLLNMSTNALESNVEAMMALSKAEAAREDLTRIAENQFEAEKQLFDLQKQLEEQTTKVAEAEEELSNAIEARNIQSTNSNEIARNSSQELVHYQYNLQVAKEAENELNDQISATNNILEELAAEYEWTMGYIAESEETLTAASENLEALGDAASSAGDSIEEMAQAAQEALAEMYDSMTELITGQIDLFAEFNGAATLSTEQLLNNMQSQVDGVRQWSDNLETLAERGISQGLLQHLADMGPKGAGYVAAFVDMTEDELQRANELYEEALSLPEDTAEKIVNSYVVAGELSAQGYKKGIEDNIEDVIKTGMNMAEETLGGTEEILESGAGESIGRDFSAGLRKGLSDSQTDVIEAGMNMAEETLGCTEEILESGAGESIGRDFSAGLSKGLSDSQTEVVNIADIIARSVLVTFQNDLAPAKFENIGHQIDAGMEKGIRAGQSGVVSAIQDMCTAAINAANTTLDIHSPSRKFEYSGQMTGAGYKKGYLEEMSDIDSTIASAMPDTVMAPKLSFSRDGRYPPEAIAQNGYQRDIYQEINIYGNVDDPIETAREFRQAQREAAKEW